MFGWASAKADTMRRVMEQSGAYDGGAVGVSSGLVAGAKVATAMGWREVDGLNAGDLVLTFDKGMQPITEITRKPVWNGAVDSPRKFWPLSVPAGALGNRGTIDLLPSQYVMIESDAGEELFGDPFSLIKAETLEGLNGIEAHPPNATAEAIVLHFEGDQVIFDQSGVLYYAPSSEGLTGIVDPNYRALAPEDAELLVGCIECDAAQSRLWAAEAAPGEFVAA